MKSKEAYGTPYTVSEARKIANEQDMIGHHRVLMLWLCDRVEELEKQIIKAEQDRQADMDVEIGNFWSELP